MLNQTAQEGYCILNPLLGRFVDMELSERIQRAIKVVIDSGRDQRYIADYCGVSPGSVTQWKNGLTKNLKFDNLYRLADLTGYSARWIAIGEGPETSAELPGVQLTSHESALLSIYRDLTQEQQEMLFGIIRGMKSVESVARPPKKKDSQASNKKAAG